jgi:hypothetical protein
VLQNNGSGKLSQDAGSPIVIPGNPVAGIVAANFNGDPGIDIAATAPVSNAVVVLLNQPPSPGGTPIEKYVTALYHDVLNRSPDPGGFAFWVNALSTGQLSRSQVSLMFFDSTEYHGIVIDTFYEQILNRHADPGGRARWVAKLDAGVPESDVAIAFVTSVEYTLSHPDNLSYVNGLYVDLLRRGSPPPLTESLPFVQALNDGSNSRADTAQLFLESVEAYFRAIDDLYGTFLLRQESMTERLIWFNHLNSQQVTPEQAGASFTASPEYFALVTR